MTTVHDNGTMEVWVLLCVRESNQLNAHTLTQVIRCLGLFTLATPGQLISVWMACLSFTLANQDIHYEKLVDNNGTGPLKVPDIHPAQKNINS